MLAFCKQIFKHSIKTDWYTVIEQFNKLGGGILYYSNRTGVNRNFIICNFEINAWNLEHNAELLQEILNRVMQRIASIVTPSLLGIVWFTITVLSAIIMIICVIVWMCE